MGPAGYLGHENIQGQSKSSKVLSKAKGPIKRFQRNQDFPWKIMTTAVSSVVSTQSSSNSGLAAYYQTKIDDLQVTITSKSQNLRRLEAQRNILNGQVRALKEELQRLQEPPANVGEVVKVMSKQKALVKLQPDGKFYVEIDKNIDPATLKAGVRVALKSDSYKLFKILPSKIDPLVSLMMVEKVPDATYEMVGGLENQIKEIKEVRYPSFPLPSSTDSNFRLLNFQLSILNYSRVLELPNQKVYFSMDLLGLERPF
jgi:prefoldin subunit 5